MNENLEILRKHIESLSDEELEAVVTVDREQYRAEAIAFAEAELERRGLSVEPEEDEPEAEAPNSFWGEVGVEPASGAEALDDSSAPAQVGFKVFRGSLFSWDELFSQAAQFASEIGAESIISISHSADNGEGIVTVWYMY